jgi:hypothetical protein
MVVEAEVFVGGEGCVGRVKAVCGSAGKTVSPQVYS